MLCCAVCCAVLCTGGSKESDPCDICPVGTFSPGFSHDRCVPCGFGYTSHIGAKQERDCYPVDACPAGTGLYMEKLSTVMQQLRIALSAANMAGVHNVMCVGFQRHQQQQHSVWTCLSHVPVSSHPCSVLVTCAEVPHGEAGASTKECMCKPGFGSPNGEAPCR